MTSGPEHFKLAEAQLAKAHGAEPQLVMYHIGRAQVHATLALAAATAIQPSEFGRNRPESQAWHAAVAVSES